MPASGRLCAFGLPSGKLPLAYWCVFQRLQFGTLPVLVLSAKNSQSPHSLNSHSIKNSRHTQT